MNIKNEIIHLNNITEDNLGIKVFIAQNTQTNTSFAIIADVNPAGYCYLKSVSPGDILLSLNGIEISTSDIFNNVTKTGNPINQISIKKKGILDGSDLFQRCINSPCTDFCETWNDKSSKITMHMATTEKKFLLLADTAFTLKSAKNSKPEEVNSMHSFPGNTEEPVISGKLFASNIPKIKFHQKVAHTSKNNSGLITNESPTVNIVLKPTKRPTNDIMIARQPRFIKRSEPRWYVPETSPVIKQVSSLNNLADIDDKSNFLDNPSPTDSSSSPLKNNFSFTNEQITKPIPMPRIRKNMLIHKRSFALLDSSSLESGLNNIENDASLVRFDINEMERVDEQKLFGKFSQS